MRNLGLVISLPANSIVVANSLCQFAELKKKKEKKKGFPTNIAATRENHSSPTSSLVAAAGRRKHFIISRPNPRSLSFSHMSVSPSAKDMQIQPNEAEKPMKPKVLTLVIIEKEGEVLLGMKKRGFGQGYYNGFGGKVETGETVEEAAARELKEEAGVVAVSMEKRGILTFHFDDNPQPWEVRTDVLLLLCDIHVVFWKSKQSRNCVYSFIRDCKCFDALETFCRCMSTMCLILLVNLVSLRRWLLYGSLMLTYHMIECGKMINFGTQSSCKGDDFAGNFTFTTHTHWFPTLYNLWPSCKPIICTWLPTSDRVLATLTSKIFPVKIFCIFCN
jgi:hypothetical protein